MTAEERKFAVTVESPSTCKRVLSFKIPLEELEREKARVLKELQRDVKVPGFRKGKIPPKYIEKHYAQVIHGDAVRNLLPAVYENALVREGITPVGEPSFENLKAEEGQDITVDVIVEVRPKVEVKGYRGVKVRVAKRDIHDAAVDEALAHLRERLASYRVVDREVRDADLVVIDYAPVLASGEIDEKRLTRNYPADLSAGSLLEEFRQGLPGLATGEHKDIHVRYPEDFPDRENAGQERTFRVTVKEVKEKVVPELDDTFAKQVGGEGISDLASLRERVRDDLIEDEAKRYQHEVEERIIDKLIEQNPFEVPRTMVDNYLASIVEEDRKRRPQVADEDREREVREHFHEAAVRSIKKYFVLEAIRRQEGIAVEPADVDGRIEEIVARSGEKQAEVRSYLAHPERRRSLENEMLDRRILDFLRDAAEIKAA